MFAVWSYARESYHTMQSVNRRDVDSIDLNKDGRVDVEELAKVIGAREARDLMEFMSDSCKTNCLSIYLSIYLCLGV